MALKNMHNRQAILDTIVYIGSFFLFWEWLRPLEQITDTADIFIFVLYTAFCFFLSYMQLKWWIGSPLKLVGLLFILDGLFFYDPFLSKEWRIQFINEIQFNISAMMNQEWWEMTSIFRSLLFLILLWLMSYLLYYWFVVAKRVVFFVLLTFIYLTVIDTFTAYDGTYAIVRTFLISLIIVGLANFQRILMKEKIFRIPKDKYVSWIMPLVTVILLSSIIGYAAPKFSPQWPDPVPFIKSAAAGAGGEGSGSGIKKVGYGENDERLGGSFVQDETVVFHATVENGQYWKIETKDVYTGKGWVRSNDDEPFVDSTDGSIEMNDFSPVVETVSKNGELAFNPTEKLPKLAYPYGVSSVSANEPVAFYSYRQQSNEIYALNTEGDTTELIQYEVGFHEPTYSLKALREVDENADPEEVKEQYTQVPENLPERVQELALELTAEETNRYDKAKAIEDYLDSARFQYSTTGVAVPGEDEDYVDQFLFETQIGYCDNFSTSMVVLLRSLDIPARWVKGFAPGEEMDQLENGQRVYEVTNANAHSWVEVYFPEIGWVPFEPTKGFFNPTDFTSGLDLEELINNQEDKPDVPASNMEEPKEEEKEENSTAARNWSIDIDWKDVFVGASVLLIVGLILYVTRFKWLTWYKIKKYRKKADLETYVKEYKFLLALLAKKGLKLQSDQTLREFAIEVDKKLHTIEMRRLTSQYEKILYKKDPDETQWGKLTEHWETLINRILTNL
ncbi:transglutaminase-like domain-containing protein [Salirhabdus sp. Marseille-P4669]|uniref:transglutaminase-like domain-containing protein n=1 Tax=Salirhabdus sp. Marseille-P4669 TaxID=2042310 RepID=UPI000C7A8F69|nr:transglutaminase-like domain-containing protein [Salirhabdus sp. Marseille-P4669]